MGIRALHADGARRAVHVQPIALREELCRTRDDARLLLGHQVDHGLGQPLQIHLVVVRWWWWLVVGGWWLVVGGWWLVVGGWWLVVGGWWLVVGGVCVCVSARVTLTNTRGKKAIDDRLMDSTDDTFHQNFAPEWNKNNTTSIRRGHKRKGDAAFHTARARDEITSHSRVSQSAGL
jgi:hypothetical protein